MTAALTPHPLSLRDSPPLHAGCRQYPDNKVLAIHLGNYRMFATFDVNGAASASEKARAGTTAGAVGHKPKEGHASGIVESCMLSWLLLEVRERSGTDSGGGESSMTLAQYVEFQDTFAYILHLHAAAAHADRRFWRMLVVKRLTFKQLAAALGHIESAQAKAFKEFKAAAEKYPKNVQLLRAYGHFMDAIKHDPDTAQRCFQEAEKLEAEAADDEGGGAGGVNDKRDAVVVISPTGIIRIANKLAHDMFGYKEDALIGKSECRPPPAGPAGAELPAACCKLSERAESRAKRTLTSPLPRMKSPLQTSARSCRHHTPHSTTRTCSASLGRRSPPFSTRRSSWRASTAWATPSPLPSQ